MVTALKSGRFVHLADPNLDERLNEMTEEELRELVERLEEGCKAITELLPKIEQRWESLRNAVATH